MRQRTPANGSATPSHIVQRNRANATRSTGPRTPAGKAIARANSVKHGLCANPAEGTVESPAHFEALHRQLIQRFAPHDPVEQALVHRVALCIWRLQRATRIDAAISGLAVAGVMDDGAEVHAWIEKLNWTGWYSSLWPETDEDFLRKMRNRRQIKKGETYYRFKRPWLSTLDKMRKEDIPKSGAAIAAMAMMLHDLTQRLEDQTRAFLPIEAQQLRWLLGEPAEHLRNVENEGDRGRDHFFYPDEQWWASETDQLIGEARKREKGTPIPPRLAGLIRGRMTAFRQQRVACEDPFTMTQEANKRTAALLPDAAMIDRMIRYETHSDRAIQRSLETLARLRGATVETISATLTGRDAAGSTVQLHGERTRWTPPNP